MGVKASPSAREQIIPEGGAFGLKAPLGSNDNRVSAWGRRVRRYERFVVAPMGGAPANEYRVTDGHVEFRVVSASAGKALGTWRALSPEDVLMHVNLKTPVGKWLVQRAVGRAV